MKFIALLLGLIAGIPLFYFFYMIFGSSLLLVGLLAIPFGIAGLYNAVYVSKDNGSYEKYNIWTLNNDNNKKD